MNKLQDLIGKPGPAEQSTFSKLAGDIRPHSLTLAFTPAQWKVIADALLTHEVDLVRRSQMFTTRAETAATPEKVARALALADERFSQSCDARDLSERISTEIRRAGK